VIEHIAKPAPQNSILDVLLGRPLASDEEAAERIGAAGGIPVFGLDALSSAAYGPEAALTILITLGMAGMAYIVPISLTIIVLLSIVYFSYRQTIAAYPTGGGSYTVATQNLGERAGLLAGAALVIDYTLNVGGGNFGRRGGLSVSGAGAPAAYAHSLPCDTVDSGADKFAAVHGRRVWRS